VGGFAGLHGPCGDHEDDHDPEYPVAFQGIECGHYDTAGGNGGSGTAVGNVSGRTGPRKATCDPGGGGG